MKREIEFFRDQYKEAYELYKKECAHSRELFDLSIKLHTRCYTYACFGFWSSVAAFGAGILIGGLK